VIIAIAETAEIPQVQYHATVPEMNDWQFHLLRPRYQLITVCWGDKSPGGSGFWWIAIDNSFAKYLLFCKMVFMLSASPVNLLFLHLIIYQI